MTAIPVEAQGVADVAARAALPPGRVAADIGLVAGRNLRKVLRNSRILVFTTVQPLLQLLFFAYVLGGVARVGGGISYKDFVVPAVLVQTVVFAGMTTGVGIANDLHTGMVDRFRSLPIARSAFLVGRTASDSLRMSIQALFLVVVSLVIGFRFHGGLLPALGMVVIIVVFGVALTTFSGWIGLAIGEPEAVQAAVFVPVLPLVFTSSAFSPVSLLPGWMQPIARVNPVTAAIDAARGLALGDTVLKRVSNTTTATAVVHFAIWEVVIVVVFTSLAVRRYRRG